MKATVLVDNINNGSIKGEWGLSIYIEYRDQNVLLDTGASALFADNAKQLHVSLRDVDHVILSHAHYDHANGIPTFFRINDHANLYLSAACGENCYFRKWIFKKYIGIPKGMLQTYQDRIVSLSDDFMISDGIYIIPHKSEGLAAIGKREHMAIKGNHGWKDDDFAHEQSLVFDTEKGLVIFNSCSHGGVPTIIKEVSATLPHKKIFAIVGGFHTHNKSDQVVQTLAKQIKATGIQCVYTGHCTGKKQYAILKEELGDMIQQLKVGLIMEF